MTPSPFEKADFLRRTIDAIPHLIFIVDADVRILFANTAAREALRAAPEYLFRRSGEVLSCIHSTEAPEGCGRAESCRHCVIRTSVNRAFRGGVTSRENVTMELAGEPAGASGSHEVYLSVSASPFQYENERFVLLVLEDIGELVQLKKMLPLCVKCKKVHTEEGYWKQIEGYLSGRLGIDFSHGLCPDCLKTLYPDFADEIGRDSR